MTSKDLQDYQTLLTALDTALDMADTLLSSGHLLSRRGQKQAKLDIQELKDFAEHKRDLLNAKLQADSDIRKSLAEGKR